MATDSYQVDVAKPPVVDNAQSKRRLHLILIVLLGVSVLFQFIAIVAPGWTILAIDFDKVNITSLTGQVSSYEGVYYKVYCTSDDCTSESHLDEYNSAYSSTKYERTKASLRHAYNKVVQRQLGFQFSWFISVAALVFLVIKMVKQKQYPRVTTVFGMLTIVACTLMLHRIYAALLVIGYNKTIVDLEDITYLGFPYCLFFYGLALIQLTSCAVLIFKEVIDHIRGLEIEVSQLKVQRETDKKYYEDLRYRYHKERSRNRSRERRSGSYRENGSRRSSYADDRQSGIETLRVPGAPSPRGSPRNGRRSPRLDNRSPESRRSRDRDRGGPRPRSRSPEFHDRYGREMERHLDRGERDRPRSRSPRPRDGSPRLERHGPRQTDSHDRPRSGSPERYHSRHLPEGSASTGASPSLNPEIKQQSEPKIVTPEVQIVNEGAKYDNISPSNTSDGICKPENIQLIPVDAGGSLQMEGSLNTGRTLRDSPDSSVRGKYEEINTDTEIINI